MKPTWDKAPSWARWLAQDSDGRWFWFNRKPEKLSAVWNNRGNSRLEMAHQATEWETSLEARPK